MATLAAERHRAEVAIARGQKLVCGLKNNLINGFSWDAMPSAESAIMRAIAEFESAEMINASVELDGDPPETVIVPRGNLMKA